MSGPIAYIAGELPTETQTFVYREIRALRERGWSIQTVSLNDPPDRGALGLRDVGDGTITVYGSGWRRTMRALLLESVSHPIRAARTVWLGLSDALVPREPTSLSARLKLPGQSLAAIGLARRLAAGSVRHIHAHFAHSPCSVAMYAARHLGIRFSFTGHANDLFQRRTLLRRKLERAAFVSSISRWHQGFYREAAAGSAINAPLIRCGVDVNAWQPASARRSNDDDVQILTVCRVVEKKGLDSLIKALHALEQDDKRRGWKLTVAGDGPCRPKLQKLADDTSLSGKITWLGEITNDRIVPLLAGADIFALPCRTDSSGDRDGIPVALMEAMACGVPVVSGDLPAIRELIDDQTNGILISDPASPAGIARLSEALARLADDQAERHRVAGNARRRIEEEFSLERNISLLERSLSEVLDAAKEDSPRRHGGALGSRLVFRKRQRKTQKGVD